MLAGPRSRLFGKAALASVSVIYDIRTCSELGVLHEKLGPRLGVINRKRIHKHNVGQHSQSKVEGHLGKTGIRSFFENACSHYVCVLLSCLLIPTMDPVIPQDQKSTHVLESLFPSRGIKAELQNISSSRVKLQMPCVSFCFSAPAAPQDISPGLHVGWIGFTPTSPPQLTISSLSGLLLYDPPHPHPHPDRQK